MYLVIDKEYRIYQTPILSGYVRAQAHEGNLSVVNLSTMQGMNLDRSWSDVQQLTENFTVDGDLA
jgi:hypothetical protein